MSGGDVAVMSSAGLGNQASWRSSPWLATARDMRGRPASWPEAPSGHLVCGYIKAYTGRA